MFKYDSKDIINRIQTYSVSHISSTATLYKMIVDDNITFDSVKQITFGGEVSTKKIQMQIAKHFPNAKIKNIYASTESGCIFASDGDLFKIPESNLNLIKVHNSELWIHKSIIGEFESNNFNGEWYNTGDLVEFVDKHNFKILGRNSNVIKIAGYNINLESVENKIQKLNFVKLCKIYSKKNSVLGNIIICEIVPNDNFINEEKSKELLKSTLEKYEVPTKIKYVKSIEINENGKIKR
jgi:acyl-coenzyme A synthetase/AMP-(fatty) acid ligase